MKREDKFFLALEALQKSASYGSENAMFNLGYGYWLGDWSLMKDEQKAAAWFSKSAERVNVELIENERWSGMAFYAHILNMGYGTSRNLVLLK